METLRAWARRLKADALTLWLLARDPRTPWWLKGLALAIAAYAFSPIDLIPDFIPVLGLLDDLVILPLGVALAVRLAPPELLADCRDRARALAERPVSRAAAAVVVLVWLALAALLGLAVSRRL